MNILITGGSGLIGTRLTKLLESSGHEVAWLTRNVGNKPVKAFGWNVEKGIIDDEAFLWANAIVHLAGEGIADKSWTANRKAEIIKSRVDSTALLNTYLQKISHQIHTIIAASAIGYYGDTNRVIVDENSKPGSGFLSESCIVWENATQQLEKPKTRLVTLRIGVVLASEGGALKELTKTIPFGIAPILGNGNQMYSWIAIDDVCQLFQFALEHHSMQGIFNAVAPTPVTQKQLIKVLLNQWKKQALRFPTPAFVLRLVLGEMADVLLLSQNVSSQKVIDQEFKFMFPTIEKALLHLK